MLRLRLYDCARLYIVKYRQCLAFGNIYIGDHFSVAREEKRPPKVAQVAVCRRSEHRDVYIGCQHQRCLHYCLGQGTGSTQVWKCTVSFAPCSVCGISTYNLRSTAEINGQEQRYSSVSDP